ncbi:MAG: glycine--tRNA ligase [Chloroflexi bacterium]|nr:glycine--tRNA ligase [Chloroflexota bacterium]
MTSEATESTKLELPEGTELLERLVSLCKRRGFVFQNSEIYGGVAGVYDFGPLGVEMRRNLKDLWWNYMVRSRENVVGIEGAILTHPRVWEASGHVENFSDPLVDCKSCRRRFRADHLIEANEGAMPDKCPVCGGELTEPRRFNLLMETELGVVEGERMKTYLRGEACQNIYLDWDNVMKSSRVRIPFGICQIGKAFRNEVTLGPFIMRQREFEQWDLQFFTHPNEMEQWFAYWQQERSAWCQSLVNRPDRVRLREHAPDELAHYAKRATDIEYDVPGMGWKEWEGIHWRGDWDLSRHSQFSGQDLSYTDPVTNERYIPWIVETSGGVDRTFFYLLVDAYDEEIVNGEKRTVLHLHKKVAPYKVAVLPLSKKPELTEPSRAIWRTLSALFSTEYDETQAIGRRYRRQDEIGTPYCVTFDFQSLEDQAVTIRDRDSMTQRRVPIADLAATLLQDLA